MPLLGFAVSTCAMEQSTGTKRKLICDEQMDPISPSKVTATTSNKKQAVNPCCYSKFGDQHLAMAAKGPLNNATGYISALSDINFERQLTCGCKVFNPPVSRLLYAKLLSILYEPKSQCETCAFVNRAVINAVFAKLQRDNCIVSADNFIPTSGHPKTVFNTQVFLDFMASHIGKEEAQRDSLHLLFKLNEYQQYSEQIARKHTELETYTGLANPQSVEIAHEQQEKPELSYFS